MYEITRNALKEIDRLLSAAGWTGTAEQAPALTERASTRHVPPPETSPPSKPVPFLNDQNMTALRHAYNNLLRADYFQILQNTLEKNLSIQEASQAMGLSEEEGNKLFAEALERLADFVKQSEREGLGSDQADSAVGSSSKR